MEAINEYFDRARDLMLLESGAENARLVREQRAANSDLSPNESDNPFVAPTLELGIGQVYQAAASCRRTRTTS